MEVKAEKLKRGDYASLLPNPIGEGVKRPAITGLVLGKTKSQNPDVPNLVVQVKEGLLEVKKSVGGNTRVGWYEPKDEVVQTKSN